MKNHQKQGKPSRTSGLIGLIVLSNVITLPGIGISDDRVKKLDPKHSSGLASRPIPSRAKGINRALFERKLKSGQIRLDSAEIRKKQKLKRAKTSISIRRDKAKLRRKAPKKISILGKQPKIDRRLKKLKSGNYELRIKTKSGRSQIVQTLGEESSIASLIEGQKKQNLVANFVPTYSALLKKTKKNPKIPVRQRVKIPIFRNPMTTDLKKLKASIELMISLLDLYGDDDDDSNNSGGGSDPDPAPEPEPFEYATNCGAEQGAGDDALDRTGTSSACQTFSDVGIVGNVDFALREHLTCPKNQANRGTCVAFATVAAVETLVSKIEGKKVNLSEQKFYNVAKKDWLGFGDYGDGLMTYWTTLVSALGGYGFTWERHWEYNPSFQREDVGPPVNYTNSCDNYDGAHCSDTNHQSSQVCTNFLGLQFCGWEADVPAGPATKISEMAEIYNLFDVNGSISNLIAHVRDLKVPVIMSFDVAESFDSVDADGFVEYTSSEETSRGRHAATVMGYVSNVQLPAGAPSGSGGGYFILKNSWGECTGDRGFYYLPKNWVKKHAYSFLPVYGLK